MSMQFLLASLISHVSDIECLNDHFTETLRFCFLISLSSTILKSWKTLNLKGGSRQVAETTRWKMRTDCCELSLDLQTHVTS